MYSLILNDSGDSIIVDDTFLWPGAIWIDAGYARVWYKGRNARLHRLLLDAPADQQVDHINNNKLDNRIANLRLSSAAENSYNHKHRIGARSQFKGVTQNTKGWIARIQKDGIQYNLGTYKTEKEAASAYDRMANKLFGKFAYLNRIVEVF